jgi:hypothetical protein
MGVSVFAFSGYLEVAAPSATGGIRVGSGLRSFAAH